MHSQSKFRKGTDTKKNLGKKEEEKFHNDFFSIHHEFMMLTTLSTITWINDHKSQLIPASVI